MSSAPLPKSCSDKFQKSDPFTYNRDSQHRDELIKFNARVTDPGIGVAWFEEAPLHLVAQLFEEKFIDPFDRQNQSPTAVEFLEFMCQHPYALASGYFVSPDREDYRVALESITIPAQYVTSQVKDEFEIFCQNADEVSFRSDLYCWWD